MKRTLKAVVVMLVTIAMPVQAQETSKVEQLVRQAKTLVAEKKCDAAIALYAQTANTFGALSREAQEVSKVVFQACPRPVK